MIDKVIYEYRHLKKRVSDSYNQSFTNTNAKRTETPYIYEKKGVKYKTYTNLDPKLSAFVTLTNSQKLFWGFAIGLILSGLIIALHFTLVIIIGILTAIYLADFLFTLVVIAKSFGKRSDVKFTNEELVEIDDNLLPKYTILCPLYKEWQVIEQFVKAIEIIDWPKDKLEVIFLLEEDDAKTINMVYDLQLPDYFKIEVVPDSFPKTKPKACNWGLIKASGEYLVVYDAEDKPDPLQLKKAYLAFKKLTENVVCLQSKLNYYNEKQNILTRLFTAEYSYWFDIALPGLQSLGTIIPLGGTSNHFKTNFLKHLQGWDPFNVTEDCDLGTRLFKEGYKTAVIDSETLEEANSNLNSWIKQRSRWVKGYMQTYLVHMRDPIGFLREYKHHALFFQLIIGMRMVFMIINPLMWFMTIAYFAMYPVFGPIIESLYPWYIFYPAIFCLIFANFTYFYSYMIASAKKDKWDLIQYIFLIPFYWILTSVSAGIAFYQLITKPYYWEKTEHGLHLGREGKEEKQYIVTGVSIEPSLALTNLSKIIKVLMKYYSELKSGVYFEASLEFIKRRPGSIDIFNNASFLKVNWLSFIKLFEKSKVSRSKNNKENILIFNWRDTKHKWYGGAEVYVQEIAERWVKKGYGVTIFCGNDGESKYDERIKGVNIIRRGGFFTLYIWAGVYYLLKLRNHFDFIIDCENGVPFFTPVYSSKPKILLIHHVHQQVFRENLPLFPAILAMFLESKVMKAVYKNIKIVTVSKSSKTDIGNLKLSVESEIDIVNPGLSLRNYIRMNKYKDPTFSYLGRLMPYKNVGVLIEAFREVLQKIPNAKLIIAGKGPDEENLKELVQKLGLKDYIDFKGFVTENEKRRILARSWVLIQPSSFEGWGITVMEANASGTTVIASDTAGLRDSVVDGQTGLLVETGNVKGLSRAMIALTDMDGYRSRLSKNAYEWSRTFSWNYSEASFLNIMNREIEKGAKVAISQPEYVSENI